ncbi:MAG: hypothetical protein F7B11_05235 [Caldisphaeraceae archaeon]|nr:hypothetical protein [Caldisphaeraceae archaeon]
MGDDCNYVERVISSLISQGLTKDMIKGVLYYEYNIKIDDNELEFHYRNALECIKNVRGDRWGSVFKPWDCEDEVIKYIISLIKEKKGYEDVIYAAYLRYYIYKRGDNYIMLTQRDIKYAYEIALYCMEKEEAASSSKVK